MKFIFLTLFLHLAILSYCQYYTIKGRVLDISGNPVSYATIKSIRTNETISSNKYGAFEFETPYRHDTLICKHISFKEQIEVLSSNDTINFVMVPSINTYIIQSQTDDLNTSDLEDTVLIRQWIDEKRTVEENARLEGVCILEKFIGIPAKYSYSKDRDLETDFRRIYDSLGYTPFNGMVKLGLSIDNKGIISNVRLIKGVNRSIDKGVVNTLINMHPWKPAVQNGRNVAFYLELQIDYKSICDSNIVNNTAN